METPQNESDRGTRPVDAGRLIYELSREYGGFQSALAAGTSRWFRAFAYRRQLPPRPSHRQ